MRPLATIAIVLAAAACGTVSEKVDPTCGEYCEAITATCTGNSSQYASEEVCNIFCRDELAFPVGEPEVQSGNSVNCRLTHTGFASRNPPDSLVTHCPHAGPTGGNTCGTWCENYCHAAVLNCSSHLFDGELAECLNVCGAELANVGQDGATGDTSGNTIQCRLTYLALAGGEAGERPDNCAAASFTDSTECR